MTARTRWQPVLHGDDAAAARRAVAEIAAAVARDAPRGYDLASGAAGVALLLGYRARVEGDAGDAERAAALLDRASDHLARAETTASLFHGFPGVAWASDHVRALRGERDLADNDEIDAAVLARLEADSPDEFDLVTGLVGLGVYARERHGHPAADRCAAQVVARLAGAARGDPGGTWWSAPHDPERIDLGLAHGVAGVIASLAGYARQARVADPAASERARELLHGAVAWLLAQRRDEGSAFPSSITSGRPNGPARSAWCYGDAAIALALARASEVGEPGWRDHAIAIARRAATRPLAETGVRDATLCHGAGALALIYQRLQYATGDPAMLAAAREWALRIFDYRCADGELAASAGFFRATRGAPVAALGLMDGVAGIGLVLLAASSDVAPDWDRALLLS
jgi:lantibiotic modifying enzyme